MRRLRRIEGASDRAGLLSVKAAIHKTGHYREGSHWISAMEGRVDVSMEPERRHVFHGVPSLLVAVTTEVWENR